MGGVTRLLLLLWVGGAVSTVVDLQKRIIGGQPCKKDERRYHVKITDGNGKLVCGGSLISDQWILTAAHCWKWTMNAVLGVHQGSEETVRITAPPVMSGYKTDIIHDIMLLKLPKATTKIQPVKLPDCGKRSKKGAAVEIAGHAATTAGPDNERLPGEVTDLQCANIQVVNCPWVSDPLQNPKPHDHRFCGKTTKVDVCHGDSGGGVVHNGMIYGVIVTSGVDACTEAAAFMDVCEYKQWIKDTTAKNVFDKLLGKLPWFN